jgi:protein ImuB
MFAVIFIPNFSLQAVLRHDPELRERAIALVDPAVPRPVIVQLTSAAQSCGACEGLTASQAIARCAELIIKPRSLAEEQSATEVLLQTAYAFSPNIESTAPGVCTMELKGLPFLSKPDSLEQWAANIIEVLAQFYIEAKIGFAVTPELALLSAQPANPVLILQNSTNKPNVLTFSDMPPDSAMVGRVTPCVPLIALERPGNNGAYEANALDSFPLSSLEPPPEILEILQRWGIRTIGELLALGKDNVAERLGPAVVDLFNRISPDSPRPLKLVVPPQEFAEQMDFEHEIETAEPLLFVLRRFVEQLSRRLELIYLVIAEFHLHLGLSSGSKYERVFKIPSPTGSIEILFRMLQTHLETVRTDSPITSLRLSAKPAKPEAQQFGLFESTLRDSNQFAETLARLTALVGLENIGTPELVASHKPDSFRITVPEFESDTWAKNPSKHSRIASQNLGQPMISSPSPPRGGGEGRGEVALRAQGENSFSFTGVHGERTGLQLRRFRPPLTSHIEFREGKPSLLRSSIFVGAIVETRGPFLSSGSWWDANRWERQEWDVETSDGSLFRIFVSNEGCFVEGVYD